MDLTQIRTPQEAVAELYKTRSVNDICDIIKCPITEETVLKVALDRATSCFDNTGKNHSDICAEIINNNKVTPDILTKVISKTKCAEIIAMAVKSPKANEFVLNKALDRATLCFDNIGKNHSDICTEIINNNKVTPDILTKVISKTKCAEIIVMAVKSPKANEFVLNKALDRATSCFDNIGKAHSSICAEIINNNKVTTDILKSVILKTRNLDIIKKDVRSPITDESVLNCAEDQANKIFSVGGAYHSSIFAEVRRVRTQGAVKQPVKLQDISQSNSQENPENDKKDDEEDKGCSKISELPPFIVEKEDTVTERLRRNVEDGMSTMLWGLSGVGKTSRVREIDPDYTMIKLKNGMLPEEVVGGKEPNGKPGEIYPPNWYVKLIKKCEAEPNKMHILFIDEITNVKDSVKSLVWEIIEDRRVNGNEDWLLPENCAIVAAGNRPNESTSVIIDYNGGVLPEPLHDRFDFHIEIPLDIAEWQQWALETDFKTGNLNIHPAVLSFCVANADKVMFSNLDNKDVTQPRLSPRRWAKLSKAIYMAEKRGGDRCHVSNQRIAECIGKDLAPAFIAHYEKPPIDMRKVEQGKYKPGDFNNIDDKLFALGSLIAKYSGSELAAIDFVETCLGEDYVSVYNVMRGQRLDVLSIKTKPSKEENHTTQHK